MQPGLVWQSDKTKELAREDQKLRDKEDSIEKNPDSINTYFSKQSLKYEVKTTDDGKTLIEIIK